MTRELPEQHERVETGTVQFGDDWPGVFIRGDNALHFGFSLQTFLQSDRADAMLPIEKAIITGLASTLMACDARDDDPAQMALDELNRRGIHD